MADTLDTVGALYDERVGIPGEFARILAARDAARDAEVAERIAQAIERAGREDVGWLAQHQDDRIDSARIVGAEDAWKNAVRTAREAGRTPPPTPLTFEYVVKHDAPIRVLDAPEE